MNDGKILILGATGNVGTPLVEELVRRGAPVRAAVRGVPESTHAAGAEVVEFDFFDRATYEKAFHGVRAVYLLTPITPDLKGLTRDLVEAAKASGVRKIVKQSAHGADTKEQARLLNWHSESERIVQDSGIPFVFLRPTGFFQNYLGFAEDISNTGVFHLSMGSDRAAHIDARDVAQVAAQVLTEPGHEGQIYSLSGPQSLSNEDIADILSRATGDQIKYVPISDEVERRDLREENVPDWLAEGLVELYRFWRHENAATVTPAFHQVTGRDPRRFEDFAREFAGRFKRRAVA